MLAYNEKNDVIVCVRGQCLYAVPKNTAGQLLLLGRADEVLHFGEFAKAQADKKPAAKGRHDGPQNGKTKESRTTS